MSEPIPFPGKPESDQDPTEDMATEVTLEGGPIIPYNPPMSVRPGDDLVAGLSEVLMAPLTLLPDETRDHLRAAGREATLTFASLAGTVLKGAAIALNVAAETLKDYSERHSDPNLDARQQRRAIEIEVE